MEIGNYNALIIKACNTVRRNKGINVSFTNNSFYGVHKYSQENVYKLDLNINNEVLTLYVEEGALLKAEPMYHGLVEKSLDQLTLKAGLQTNNYS